MSEKSPEYDPQANGSAELGVQIVKGMLKTHRSSLEEELGYRVPVRHPLIAWLTRHAANIVTWTVKGPDGLTAYQRARSKPFTTRLLRFGERCTYKIRSQEPLAPAGDGRKWHVGTFVGVDQRTGQYMIHDSGNVKFARTLLRMPEPDKFDKDELAKIVVTPWDLWYSMRRMRFHGRSWPRKLSSRGMCTSKPGISSSSA